MTQDTETLAREAETRRSSVESTLEELRSRMSVGQIVDEFAGYMREGQAGAMAQNLGRQVRDNPLALGLVGAGIAWLLMGDGIRDTSHRVADRFGHDDDDVDDVALRMSGEGSQASTPLSSGAPRSGTGNDPSSSEAKGRLAGAASAVSSGVSAASSSAGSAASSVSQGIRRATHDTRDAMTQAERAAMRQARSVGRGAQRLGGNARRTFVDTLQEEPLVVGALALAIGAAIGASLPSSRIEDEYLGEARDELRDQAMGYGADALESGKRVVERTYQAASEAAEERGLKPTASGETLAEKVAGVVGTAAQAAKSEARQEGLI